MKRELLIRCSILIVGMLLGIALFLIGDRLLISYEVSKLPAPFKLLGEQGLNMFSDSCNQKILHLYNEDGNSDDVVAFLNVLEGIRSDAQGKIGAMEVEVIFTNNQLAFFPMCDGSSYLIFLSPDGKKSQTVLVEKKGFGEYEYKKTYVPEK